MYIQQNIFFFKKLRADAPAPYKLRSTDSGYDLTILEKAKTIGNVELYSTGIAVQHNLPGWYFDMVPRSSIIRSGYILANSVGIIDYEYIGEIMVPLIKIDQSAPDILALGPAKIVQLIPRQIQHFLPVEVEDLNMTSRGVNGFGSTNTENFPVNQSSDTFLGKSFIQDNSVNKDDIIPALFFTKIQTETTNG